tara:strand:- start:3736 stop:3846 length:111 start_codon:yes stop_codon:yes gene_type:complete
MIGGLLLKLQYFVWNGFCFNKKKALTNVSALEIIVK